MILSAKWPIIIQGGMGAGVSHWFLAKTVSKLGQLGVVSGVALDTIMVRRLQLGDPDGHIRRALDHFPIPEVAQRIYDQYFVPGGKVITKAFKRIPMWTIEPSQTLNELAVVANFTEVFLAKEDHSGQVGINYLEKIQMPILASIYGAMLAGVDYVLMGAGIPREIPGVLDRFIYHKKISYKINVVGAGRNDDWKMEFDPKDIIGSIQDTLKRPFFLAIISSAILAVSMVKKSTGAVNGFVIEGPTAGGHNAPPRGALKLTVNGEPIYGERDIVDLDKIKELGLPIWLAGSFGASERIQEILDQGATGVQVGTPFAFCEESGIPGDIKCKVLEKICVDGAEVFTDPFASPTGFPFKVLQLEGTMSDETVYQKRSRICDLGYLRTVYKKPDGKIGYRCPSEPADTYLRKGGNQEDTEGRKCLCNSLVANVGMTQIQVSGYVEKPLITTGEDFSLIHRILMFKDEMWYSAADVIRALSIE
ncbi:MAG: nitronate monooxygenase [Candidatus Falkowbacteria bacterium]